MKTKEQLLLENCQLNTKIAMQIIDIQVLKNEIDDLKQENEVLTKKVTFWELQFPIPLIKKTKETK